MDLSFVNLIPVKDYFKADSFVKNVLVQGVEKLAQEVVFNILNSPNITDLLRTNITSETRSQISIIIKAVETKIKENQPIELPDEEKLSRIVITSIDEVENTIVVNLRVISISGEMSDISF